MDAITQSIIDRMEARVHDEHRISERAYHLWQKEGSPHGRDHEFWERARLMEAASSAAPIGTPLSECTPDERRIDVGLEETFPASDPIAASNPSLVAKARVPRRKK